MVRAKQVLRGEVWIAELDPTVGSEIQKTRPCLIVSPDEMNRILPTVTILPMTTGSRLAPFRIGHQFRGKKGITLPDQMRTLDKSRLLSRSGAIDTPTLITVLYILREMFAE